MIDVTAILDNISGGMLGAITIAMAFTVAKFTLKALHLIARTDEERARDESRDWDDRSSTSGRWYD